MDLEQYNEELYNELKRPRNLYRAISLIQAGADVDVVNILGQTSLHIATQKGELDSIKKLVGLGANIDALCGMNRTPLTVAVREDNIDAVKILLELGADVSIKGCIIGNIPMSDKSMSKPVKELFDRHALEAEVKASAQRESDVMNTFKGR